jgi:hypothetical protein
MSAAGRSACGIVIDWSGKRKLRNRKVRRLCDRLILLREEVGLGLRPTRRGHPAAAVVIRATLIGGLK